VVSPVIDDPHDDAANEQGESHGNDAAQIALAPLAQQQGGHGSDGESDEGERDGVGKQGAVAIFAAREGAEEFDDAAEEEQGEGEDGAELNDDVYIFQ